MHHLIYDDDGCQGNNISQSLEYYGNCEYNVTCSYSIIQFRRYIFMCLLICVLNIFIF